MRIKKAAIRRRNMKFYRAMVISGILVGAALSGNYTYACDMQNCENRKVPGSCDLAQAAYNACLKAEQDARMRASENEKLKAARGAGTLQKDIDRTTNPPRQGGNVGRAN
jgi:hypothetical protein